MIGEEPVFFVMAFHCDIIGPNVSTIDSSLKISSGKLDSTGFLDLLLMLGEN
jgi:hypothetical protein